MLHLHCFYLQLKRNPTKANGKLNLSGRYLGCTISVVDTFSTCFTKERQLVEVRIVFDEECLHMFTFFMFKMTSVIDQCHLISELYDYCIKEGYADKNLIAKWKKQGYENLCCLRCIQTRDTNFGTNCICRVPKGKLEVVSDWLNLLQLF